MSNPEIEAENSEMRLYCLMRTDLEMPLGKALAQAGHAYVGVYEMMTPEQRDHYNQNAQPKIAKGVKNETALRRAMQECQNAGIACYMVRDAGRTVFNEPTVTCLGIGPTTRAQIPKFIDRMQLL